VMLDDFFAAGYTLIVCALLLRLAHLIGF